MSMKYFSKKVIVNGIKFDSKTEAEYYIRLKEDEKEGKIKNLQTQQSFEIIPKLIKVIPVQLKTKIKFVERVVEHNAIYTCDFMFEQDNQTVIMEIKSKATAMARDYPLRRKLIRQKIKQWNESAGYEKFKFVEIVDEGKRKAKTNKKVKRSH